MLWMMLGFKNMITKLYYFTILQNFCVIPVHGNVMSNATLIQHENQSYELTLSTFPTGMFRLSSTKITSFKSQSWMDLSSAASNDGSFLRSANNNNSQRWLSFEWYWMKSRVGCTELQTMWTTQHITVLLFSFKCKYDYVNWTSASKTKKRYNQGFTTIALLFLLCVSVQCTWGGGGGGGGDSHIENFDCNP